MSWMNQEGIVFLSQNQGLTLSSRTDFRIHYKIISKATLKEKF